MIAALPMGDRKQMVDSYMRHEEAAARIAAEPEAVFVRLDDPTKLGAHMSRRTLMMGGGSMSYDLDAARGQAVGSHIRLSGTAFGLRVDLDEVVTEHDPPRRKVWRTVGVPRLIIIGSYEMGFECARVQGGADLRVWIDYALPERGWAHRIPILAGWYARWCVQRMVRDAVTALGAPK